MVVDRQQDLLYEASMCGETEGGWTNGKCTRRQGNQNQIKDNKNAEGKEDIQEGRIGKSL